MLSCLTVSFLLAQGLFDKPPEGVEASLRERVKKFYELDIRGKKDDAAKFVAPDSVAKYKSADRKAGKSFDWNQAVWADDFQSAKVTVNVYLAGDDAPPFPMAELSHWRLEKGEWVWHLPRR